VSKKTSTANAPETRNAAKTATPPHIHADRVWLVLARRTYEEPLKQVGTIEADDFDLARVYARSIYDEFAWIEMAIIPRETIVTVIAS
jgi:hypothetical protein